MVPELLYAMLMPLTVSPMLLTMPSSSLDGIIAWIAVPIRSVKPEVSSILVPVGAPNVKLDLAAIHGRKKVLAEVRRKAKRQQAKTQELPQSA